MNSLLEIGTRGILASQNALTMTAQNIANANTPFYTRREMDFSEAFYRLYGNGVNVADVRRIFDDFADKAVLRTQSDAQSAATALEKFIDLQSTLETQGEQIEKNLIQLLTTLHTLNTDPSSLESRNYYVEQLKQLTHSFNEISQTLSVQQGDINKQIIADTQGINAITTKLADLNKQLLNKSGMESLPLLDQRDQLLNQLAQLIGIESQVDGKGALNVQLSNGTPLVNAQTAYMMKTYPSRSISSQLDIAIQVGNEDNLVSNRITTGELGGLLAYQSNGLVPAQNALGRLAVGLAMRFNAQQSAGLDLNGASGQLLFADTNEPAAMAARSMKQASNQGTGDIAVHIDNPAALTLSDYVLHFDTATHYQLVRTTDHGVVREGDILTIPATIEGEGFTLQLKQSSFIAGDNITIVPTRFEAARLQFTLSDGKQLALALAGDKAFAGGDNRNGLELAQLYQSGVFEDGSLNFNQAYHQLNQMVASNVANAQQVMDTRVILKNQAEGNRDQITGVSLQEESLNLARYQQAYEANAQILEAGQKTFDILMGIIRR